MKEQIMSLDEMPIILRREVEARILKPFLEVMEKELGEERTKEIVVSIIQKESREAGKRAGEFHGGNELEDIPEIMRFHEAGGALAVENSFPDGHSCLCKTITCEYVAMYERLGMKKWGSYLSCLRDQGFFEGINPNFRFKRTETLMAGGTCCDSLVIDESREEK